MELIPPKKLLIVSILDILKKHTDAEHRLSQREIIEILARDYALKAERKAVKRNLMNLIDFGCGIEYSERVRIKPNGEEERLCTDWYLERDFSDAELRLLIDSVLFSKHIAYSQCKELVRKLEGLSSKYFAAKVRHVSNMQETGVPQNPQLFYNVEILDEAIEKGRKVSFFYNEFGTDKAMHPRRDENGKPREYLVNPYQMVAANGRYYLICNYDKYEDAANYRVDRITDIRLLDTPAKPMEKVRGLEHGLDLPRHMAEHIYMFTGESGPVTFRAKRYLLSEVIDWFGTEIQLSEITEETVTVRVTVNLEAMRRWALQYALHVKVLSPQSLAEGVCGDLERALEAYRE